MRKYNFSTPTRTSVHRCRIPIRSPLACRPPPDLSRAPLTTHHRHLSCPHLTSTSRKRPGCPDTTLRPSSALCSNESDDRLPTTKPVWRDPPPRPLFRCANRTPSTPTRFIPPEWSSKYRCCAEVSQRLPPRSRPERSPGRTAHPQQTTASYFEPAYQFFQTRSHISNRWVLELPAPGSVAPAVVPRRTTQASSRAGVLHRGRRLPHRSPADVQASHTMRISAMLAVSGRLRRRSSMSDQLFTPVAPVLGGRSRREPGPECRSLLGVWLAVSPGCCLQRDLGRAPSLPACAVRGRNLKGQIRRGLGIPADASPAINDARGLSRLGRAHSQSLRLLLAGQWRLADCFAVSAVVLLVGGFRRRQRDPSCSASAGSTR